MKRVNLEWFTNMKSGHKVLLIVGGVVIISGISKAIHDAVKKRTAINSFGNENISVAKSLYTALYPEGKPDAKFSIWNPFSTLNVIGDVFKSNADITKLMRIAGNDLTSDNFKKVASAYSKLYNSDLLFDLQDRMDEDFDDFDYKVRHSAGMSDEQRKNVAKVLAQKMYDDMDAYFTFSVNDSLYDKLAEMSDKDFILVYNEFQKILNKKDRSGTLRTWVEDDSRTMDSYKAIDDRMTELGLA